MNRKRYVQFRVVHYPHSQGIDQVDEGLHVVAFDEGDKGLPDLDFVRWHYARLSGHAHVEFSEFERTEILQSKSSGAQEPAIRGEGAEVFVIPNSRKTDSAVPEIKLHDPTFKVDPA